MKSNELTIQTPVSEYTNNQIKEAIKKYFNCESPLELMIATVDLMTDYIMDNSEIEEGTKKNFALIERMYRFNLKLFKEQEGFQ